MFPRHPAKTRFLTTTAAVALAAMTLAGCSSLMPTSRPQAYQVPESRPAIAEETTVAHAEHPAPAPAPVEPNFERTYHNVDFAGRETKRETRHAALVGLYGELIERPSPATGRFDGADNLIPITVTADGACFDPDVDRTGRKIAFASTQHRQRADIYLKSSTGQTQRQLTSDPADDVMPKFSPDGRNVAFASNRFGSWDIFVISTDGGPARPITEAGEDELHPTWSPDGTMIAYCKLGMQSGRWEIWVVDLTTGMHQSLTYGLFPDWNPDPARNKIAFQKARERGSRLFSIWTIDYVAGEGSHKTEIVSAANAAVMHPSWSPDGSRLVFVTIVDPDEHGTNLPPQSDLWIVNHDGTAKTNLTQGQFRNLSPVWASDGTVYFLSDRSGADNVWAVATGRTIDPGPAFVAPLATVDPATQAPAQNP